MNKQRELFYQLIMQSPHIGVLTQGVVYGGQAGRLQQSDVIQLYLQIENAKISDVKFQAQGSAATLAAAAWLSAAIMGLSIKQATAITAQQMSEALQLKYENHNSPLLAIDALAKALENYHE